MCFFQAKRGSFAFCRKEHGEIMANDVTSSGMSQPSKPKLSILFLSSNYDKKSVLSWLSKLIGGTIHFNCPVMSENNPRSIALVMVSSLFSASLSLLLFYHDNAYRRHWWVRRGSDVQRFNTQHGPKLSFAVTRLSLCSLFFSVSVIMNI